MHYDFLIIGQGISGTFLSWYLQKAGYSWIMIDELDPNSASRVAAGIINPVTGRRIVKTWMIDELLPFSWDIYYELGQELGITSIAQKNIIDFFSTPQMKEAFFDRYNENTQYIGLPDQTNQWSEYFNYEFGYGIIEPSYLVSLQEILLAYRKQIHTFLLEERFDLAQLKEKNEQFHYKDITASHIIFCDGSACFESPIFRHLPFAPNKGEVLWIESRDIPTTHIFKKGLNLVHWNENIFWIGSSYEWQFKDAHPTELFKNRTMTILKQWLKTDFTVIDHKASIRPATLERRPFVGFHPVHKKIGIFNGMGTKGCSLAPYFAKQFVDHIQYQKPLHPEADIHRFRRILSSGQTDIF